MHPPLAALELIRVKFSGLGAGMLKQVRQAKSPLRLLAQESGLPHVLAMTERIQLLNHDKNCHPECVRHVLSLQGRMARHETSLSVSKSVKTLKIGRVGTGTDCA